MADPQDRPDNAAKKAPAKKTPAKAAKKAHQAPAKAAKKSQPAAPKKTPARKGPAKDSPPQKAPAKKAPAKKAESATKPITQPFTQPQIDTNRRLVAAAKDAAAQAKSTVDAANNPVSEDAAVLSATRSLVPLMVAIAASLLMLVLLRQLRRHAS